MKTKKKPIIQSIGRAIQILKCFETKKELGVTEISKAVDLHKSTTSSIVLTLEYYGFLEKNNETNRYKLGNELFRLGSLVESNLKDIAAPYIKELSNVFNETVNLVVKEGSYVLYLEKIESSKSMYISTRIGGKMPLYCTAVGKAILAYMKEDTRKEIIDKIDFIKYTSSTITDNELFKAHLEDIKLNGYAEDMEELETGLVCIAAPIINNKNEPIAAVSISGPVSRMTQEFRQSASSRLIQAASNISSKL